MATITEDYVSFEIAKLLKEKGFNESCYTYYDYIDNTINRFDKGFHFNNTAYPWGVPYDINKAKKYVVAPTLQTAMKWLREVHNLFIEPRVGETDDKTWYDFDIIPINGRKVDWNHYTNLPLVEFNSYEEVVELALKYCLENLIE